MSFVRQAVTRYGPLFYNPNDLYVGRSIELYGEAHQLELEFLYALCGPGSTVFDVGANIGGHAVPLARHVGEMGRVFAFEPQPVVFGMLRDNVALAELRNIEPIHAALGKQPGNVMIPDIDYTVQANYGGVEIERFVRGTPVPVRTLDEFVDLPRVDLLKIDVEGMEIAVLQGGSRLIERFRPLMYVENDREEKSAELIAVLQSMRYRMFWHLPPLFNPGNFRGNQENVFGPLLSWNMLCVPAETELEITGFTEILDPHDRPFAQFKEGVAEDERGRACVEAGRFEEAEQLFVAASAHVPDRADPLANLAYLYHLLGRPDEAIAAAERAVAIEPHHVQAHVNLALSLLLAGDYTRGFREYERRPVESRVGDLPRWDGSPPGGRALLVTREQGLGDFVLYARFFPLLQARGARVCVEVPPEMRSLFEEYAGIDELVEPGQRGDLGRYAAFVPIASLPFVLGVTHDTVPADVPYLCVNEHAVAAFAATFAELGASRTIGIVWAGSPEYAMDRYRSVAPAEFDRLAGFENVAWVSLQKGASPTPSRLSPLAIGDRLNAFADTAAAIAALDLVICVDTSVAHLAGALGKPVWLLNGFGNYWLWGLRCESTPWYPTMRLFHQPSPGDWAGLFAEVRKSLQHYLL